MKKRFETIDPTTTVRVTLRPSLKACSTIFFIRFSFTFGSYRQRLLYFWNYCWTTDAVQY